ncbi:GNAT family N-acetyltransferase [uncultured Erythrobacter sp.]|uniref:GNAT family N-acetyltransferase n=1 Tax=uncultured Erythrobacter sp. TaxID=263913 RepID=UPI0026046227|nr:GNAT family N-acetyltransferase [uncultured Erythrobacter sp.]
MAESGNRAESASRLDLTTHWIDEGNAHLLDNVAPGVFDHAIDPARLKPYLASPANWMCLALHEGQVVGMCMCVIHSHPDKPTELFLDEIGTGDDWRRQGIARALMQLVFERADAENIEEIWLGTEPDNDAANGLYQTFKHEREDAVIYYFDW